MPSGYSIVTKDVFVFIANCFGVLIGLYFTLVAYGYSTDKVSVIPTSDVINSVVWLFELFAFDARIVID